MSEQSIAPKKFTGLHAHSDFSIGDGLGRPQEHIDFAIENGMDSLALTDHGNLNGFSHQYLHGQQLKKSGQNFKAIAGIEAYFVPSLKDWQKTYDEFSKIKSDEKIAKKLKQAEKEKESFVGDSYASVKEDMVDGQVEKEIDEDTQGDTGIENEEESKKSSTRNPIYQRNHLVLLPKNDVGLKTVFGWTSKSFMSGFYRYPRMDYDTFRNANGNVIALSACVGGYLSKIIFENQIETNWENYAPNNDNFELIQKKLAEEVGRFQELFGEENYYLELQWNKLSCLRGSSLIETSEGKKTIKEIAEQSKNGAVCQVKSYNEETKRIEYKDVLWGDVTKKDAKVVKIKLKNGQSVVLTPDHKVFTDNGWLRADELKNHPKIKILSNSHKLTSGIYRIINTTTNQVYYGSSVNLVKRINSHKSKLARNIHDNQFLQSSYNKYGVESFKFEIVELLEPNKSLLLEKEQRYIDSHFDSGKMCFNLNPRAESTFGRKYSLETRQKLKENARRGKDHWAFGKTYSQETRDKIATALKGRKLSDVHRKKLAIAKLGKKTGPHTEAWKENASSQKLGDKNPMFGKTGLKHHGSISVIQMDLNEKIVNAFASLLEAEKYTGISFQSISLCINGKTKTSGGFKWKRVTK